MADDPSKAPRSSRFPIQAPLSYRVRGEAIWRRGMTVNISDSGALFEGNVAVGMGTAVELSIALQVEPFGEAGARITGHGVIVRTIEPHLLAVRFLDARLRRL